MSTTRRDFIKSAATLGAAAGLGLRPGGVRADDPGHGIRVGVIGTGVRGKQIMGFLAGIPGTEVVAYCDVLPFRLEEAVEVAPPGAASHSDYRKLLDDPGIDAVAIATTFSTHHRIALDALDSGKHVYCEKTMVKGIAEAGEVVAAARQRPGQVFQTGYQFRISPLYTNAAKIVADGHIGPVTAIDCQWNRNGDWRRSVPDPKWERQVNWRMYREYSSGLVAELLSHQMDICNAMLDADVESVQGIGGIDYWKDGRETYDNVNVMVRYAGGVTASFVSQTTNNLDGYEMRVLGKLGSIVLKFNEGWLIPERGAPESAPPSIDLVSGASVADDPAQRYRTAATAAAMRISSSDEDPTINALRVFADAIRNGEQPPVDVMAGARGAIMTQMALDAMDHREVVPWRDEFDFGT